MLYYIEITNITISEHFIYILLFFFLVTPRKSIFQKLVLRNNLSVSLIVWLFILMLLKSCWYFLLLTPPPTDSTRFHLKKKLSMI